MSPLDIAVVRRKMLRIAENLQDLSEVQSRGYSHYLENRLEKKGAERLLQELIEAAIDINLHILASLAHGLPDDNYGSFIALGTARAISSDLAKQLAPAAGLRNRLIHAYNHLDDQRVWDAIGSALKIFPQYLKSVDLYLKNSAPE